MPFTYDLKTDIRYKQGLRLGMDKGLSQGLSEGLSEGLNQGLSQGEDNKATVAIKQMLQNNLPLDTIAKYLQVSLDFVKKVADSLKK